MKHHIKKFGEVIRESNEFLDQEDYRSQDPDQMPIDYSSVDPVTDQEKFITSFANLIELAEKGVLDAQSVHMALNAVTRNNAPTIREFLEKRNVKSPDLAYQAKQIAFFQRKYNAQR